LARIRSGEVIHNGNRETFRGSILNLDGIPWWVVRSHLRRRREWTQCLAEPGNAHLVVHRFHHPADAAACLDAVRSMVAAGREFS
jgi:hypothetical protein